MPTPSAAQPGRSRPSSSSKLKDVASLNRLLSIITLLQGGRSWTPESLAAHFQVTERTVFRDVKKLERAGFPVHFDRAKKRYQLDGEKFLQPVQLTRQEALALFTLAWHLGQRGQIDLLAPAASAVEKISAQLPPAITQEVEQLEQHIVIQTARKAQGHAPAGIDEILQSAIASQRAVRVSYRAVNPVREDQFLLEPYQLYYGQRAWYVIGRSRKHGSVRSYKLVRIRSIEPTDEAYVIPPDFTMDKYLGNAWNLVPGGKDYAVELLFDAGPVAETVVETSWHDTQEHRKNPDGSITLKFTVSGLDEIVWWILSMGPACRVVKPIALADKVRDLARAIAAKYD
jgi:predicted DNA-binding transcriptional regulator YafY